MRLVRGLLVFICLAMTAYHVVFAYIGYPTALVHYPLHLAFVLVIFYISRIIEYDSIAYRIYAVLMIAFAIAPIVYLIADEASINARITWAQRLEWYQVMFGLMLIFVTLDCVLRVLGKALFGLICVFLGYAYFGAWLPAPFTHRGFSIERIVEQAYLTIYGFFSLPLAVTADFVFLFIFFGAFLLASGAGDFFTRAATALTRNMVGGTAKASVISSAFMGMLQGSSPGNVVTTGPFTIPAMRKSGYDARTAAGVEAVASTGGQLTPPIMGAAAFIMVEYLAISYFELMIIATIPALLYFISVFIVVDLEARKQGLVVDTESATERFWPILQKDGILLVPIIVLVASFAGGYSPRMAGLYALLTLFAVVVWRDANPKKSLMTLYEAANSAPKIIAPVTIACAAGGLIAGIITMTGLGLRISTIVLAASQGYLILALVLTMVVALILGMGMPTSAAYIILAALLATGLEQMGLPAVAAHMFIVYCAAKSPITPPVAVASYAAAAIANTDPWRTSLVAFRLGLAVFVLPFLFVYGQGLLAIGSTLEIIWATFTALIAIISLTLANVGWLRITIPWSLRLLLVVVTVMLIVQEPFTDFLAIAGLIIVVGWQLRVGATSLKH